MALPAIRPEIKAFAVGGFWLLFIVCYFNHWPIPSFHLALTATVWLALILAAATGYGQLIAQRALPRDATATEFLVFSAVLGYGVIGFLMFVAGTIGAWTALTARAIIVAGLAIQMLHPKPRLSFHRPDSIPWIAATLIATAGVISYVAVLSPITYYDSLVYHLAMPAQYVQAHHWLPLTSLIYSAFPQQMEMLWTFGLLLSGDTLVNAIGWSVAALTVLGTAAFARRYIGAGTAWTSAALLATMPAFLLLSSGGYIDIGLTCFALMSLYAILLWTTHRHPLTLLMAGALGGWAIGCKYTGALPFAIGAVIVFWHSRKSPAVLLYLGAGLLCVAPWLIKNFHYVGNPVFPFFYKWGIAKRNPWMGGAALGYFRNLTEYRPHKPWELAQLVWQTTTEGLQFGGGMDVLGDMGWAPLFALLPGLFLIRRAPATRWLLVYSALFFVAWALTRPVLRFLLPLAPVLALLSGEAWDELPAAVPRWLSRGLFVVVGLLMATNFSLYFQTADLLSLFTVPLGIASRDSFLSRRLNYFGAAQFVNHDPRAQRVLVVGDQRGYYYEKPVILTPVFNHNPLVDWAESAPDAEALRALLASQGVTHILINHPEMERLASYGILPFSPAGRERWETLLGRLPRVYKDDACEVFAL